MLSLLMPIIEGQLTRTGDLLGMPIKPRTLMSRHTGGSIYDTDHIVQGIVDILTTPIGSRVLLRTYGSNLFRLIDQPINRYLIARIYAAIIIPINTWEKRVRVRQVSHLNLTELAQGRVSFGVEGYYRAERRALKIREISLDFYRQNAYDINLDASTPA